MNRHVPALLCSLVLATMATCGIPQAKPCEDPQLYYAPDVTGDVYWGCEPPAGWLALPPPLLGTGDTGGPDTDTDTDTDTATWVTVPTGATPHTGDTSASTGGTGNPVDTMDTSAIDTMDTGLIDTFDTGLIDTFDTGLIDTFDTGLIDTFDTGFVDTGDTGAP